MKPNNILKFWFWRARLMVAGQQEDKEEKITTLQVSDELIIELHPAAGPDKRPFLKLCRRSDLGQQAINIYLKEVPGLIDLLPHAIGQLMALGPEKPFQLRTFHQVDFLKKNIAEPIGAKEYPKQ